MRRKMAGIWAWSIFLFALVGMLPFHKVFAEAQIRSAPLNTTTESVNGTVRVYLASLGNASTLHLTLNGDYQMGNTGNRLSGGSEVRVQLNAASGEIVISSGSLTWQMGSSALLRRHSGNGQGSIRIRQAKESQNPYPGDLSFHAVGGSDGYTLYVIAHIYIEDYLYGVLPYEMGNSSHIEALKAQAVAARTYTVRMMKSRASGLYDVKDTTSDQVYRGTPSGNANCKAAVDATRGIVLKYGTEYVTTYYSSSNGGQTEIARSGKPPGYMKVKDDPFDLANPASTVKRISIDNDLRNGYLPTAFGELLKEKAIAKLNRMGYGSNWANTQLLTLDSMIPHTPMYASPSRLYTKMDLDLTAAVNGGQVSLTITCDIFEELESALSLSLQSSKNELWSVERISSGFEVQVRRFGHGMGMSQRGAMYMGNSGYSYDEILGFYFEGCIRSKQNFTSNLPVFDDDQSMVEKPSENEGGSLDTIGFARVTANDFVNLRSAPSINSQILGTAPSGTLLTVLSQNGSWATVRYNAQTAYVNTAYLSEVVSEFPSDESDTELATAVVSATDGGSVNLRKFPSTVAQILTSLASGTKVERILDDGTWSLIRWQGMQGYMMSCYLRALPETSDEDVEQPSSAVVHTPSGSLNLRQEASAASRIIAFIPRGAEVAVLKKETEWCWIRYRDLTGYVMTRFLSFADMEADKDENAGSLQAYVATEAGALNVRMYPSRTAAVVAQIPRGTQLTVIQHGIQWSEVVWQQKKGYVMSAYLQIHPNTPDVPDRDESIPSGANAWVQTPGGGLNVREEPSASARVLGIAAQHSSVTILGLEEEWCRIRFQGSIGYVMKKFLTFEMPETDQTTAAYAWVNTSSGSLNLRSAPSTGSAVLASIPQYERVEKLWDEGAWTAVRYQHTQGYVLKRYLSEESLEVNSSINAPSEDAFVRDGMDISMARPDGAQFAVETDGMRLVLWTECREMGEIAGIVPAGEVVEIVLTGDFWCCVQYDGIQGYCKKELLRVI